MRRLVIPMVLGSVGLALAVMAPRMGHAGSLCVYEASVGCGNVRHVPSPAIEVVLDIEFDPGTAEYGAIYGLGEVLIESSGDVIFNACACETPGCVVSCTATEVTLSLDPPPFGIAEVTSFALLTISGTFGSVNLVSGRYFDAFFNDRAISPFTLAIVPEPVALVLLSVSLVGLGLRRHRKAFH